MEPETWECMNEVESQTESSQSTDGKEKIEKVARRHNLQLSRLFMLSQKGVMFTKL